MICGKCCFKEKMNLEERKKMFDSILKKIEAKENVFCSKCERKIVLNKNVLTTLIGV